MVMLHLFSIRSNKVSECHTSAFKKNVAQSFPSIISDSFSLFKNFNVVWESGELRITIAQCL